MSAGTNSIGEKSFRHRVQASIILIKSSEVHRINKFWLHVSSIRRHLQKESFYFCGTMIRSQDLVIAVSYARGTVCKKCNSLCKCKFCCQLKLSKGPELSSSLFGWKELIFQSSFCDGTHERPCVWNKTFFSTPSSLSHSLPLSLGPFLHKMSFLYLSRATWKKSP